MWSVSLRYIILLLFSFIPSFLNIPFQRHLFLHSLAIPFFPLSPLWENIWNNYTKHGYFCNFNMDQLKVTVHRAITYPVFRKEGVQISTHSPDTKTQFVQVAVSGREMSK
jgi:hypothetical protein